VLQFVSLATHLLFAESQHDPAPVQAVPVAQQVPPFAPQATHTPPMHAAPVSLQAVPDGQQVPPVAPHVLHVPLRHC
jgi:hypothetical protein